MKPGSYAMALCLMTATVISQAAAGTPDRDVLAALASARPVDEIPVIVTYRAATSPRALRKSFAGESRAARRREVTLRLKQAAADAGGELVERLRAAGGRRIRDLWISNAVALRATPDLLRDLIEDPAVSQVRLDRQIDAPMPMIGTMAEAAWNLEMVRAPQVWTRGYRGRGVVVGLLDTGVDASHPDLAGSWRGGTNSWFDPYAQRAAPHDSTGHGTQVLGLIVGGVSGGSPIGVAPDAQWIAARIFDDAGTADESAVHLAFQWLLDPDGDPLTDDAPDLVNNSWSSTDDGLCNSAFQPDIDALVAADIAVVFAAGNFGPSPASSVSPGNNARVQSVGAVDATGAVAEFSSRGPSACDDAIYPKVVAPGDGVMTTDLSLGGVAQYTLVAGTSFSAPHLTGVMALLRGAAPAATVEQIESAIASTASDVGAAGPDDAAGYGLVDALAALDALPVAPDNDGDGFSLGIDCDDEDATVYPGAREVRNDHVDQDCNGYDLTIRVHYAVYSHDGSALNVRATSSQGASAALEIAGVGAMTWRPRYDDWIWRGGIGASGVVRELTVRGMEGEIAVRPRMPTPSR